MSKETRKNNPWRLLLAFLYLFTGFSMIYYFRNEVIYYSVHIDEMNFYRYIWCLSSSFIGFGCLALTYRKEEGNPFFEYLTTFMFQLFSVSAIAFGILHVLDGTSGFTFYYLSFGLCFILSYFIETLKLIPLFIVKRLKL